MRAGRYPGDGKSYFDRQMSKRDPDFARHFAACDAACDPPAAPPDVDLTAILRESMERIRRGDLVRGALELDSSIPLNKLLAVEKCCTCGDEINPADADNFTRPAGYNKAGRTDCGTCVRGMRRNCD